MMEIRSPYDGRVVNRLELASDSELRSSAERAEASRHALRNSSRATRAILLRRMAEQIEARRQELTESIVNEAGKPWTLADAEVTRGRITFETAAEECKRFGGEVIPMDTELSSQGFDLGVVRWIPRGPVLGITPFNFPLNLVAHKVAPALASANPIVIKPAPQTPGAALILHSIFKSVANDFPTEAFQVVCCANSQIPALLESKAFETVSFTGSAEIGWGLYKTMGRKKLLLELGGNAAVIVDGDLSETALAGAASRVAFGSNAYAGQTCISVQRVFVHRSVEKSFTTMLLEKTQALVCGDPKDKTVTAGPMISEAALSRVDSWVQEAIQNGARLLCGGKRKDSLYQPTVLTNVPRSCKVSCEEVFGPVMVLETFEDFDEALRSVNDSPYGLQAGLFSNSAANIAKAQRVLNVGGLAINEIPTFRADHMPYGGVKASGLGREGLRYAMEEFSERMICFSKI